MTKRVNDFGSWTRQVERRLDRLERLPRQSKGGGSGSGVVAAYYSLPFLGGVGVAALPVGVPINAHVVGSFRFETGEEVGLAASILNGVAMVRAAVSDGTYGTTLVYVEP